MTGVRERKRAYWLLQWNHVWNIQQTKPLICFIHVCSRIDLLIYWRGREGGGWESWRVKALPSLAHHWNAQRAGGRTVPSWELQASCLVCNRTTWGASIPASWDGQEMGVRSQLQVLNFLVWDVDILTDRHFSVIELSGLFCFTKKHIIKLDSNFNRYDAKWTTI